MTAPESDETSADPTMSRANGTRIRALENALRHLQDKDAIIDLLNKFAYSLDSRRWDDWESCFAVDGTISVPSGTSSTESSLSGWAQKALGDFAATLHVGTNFDIRFVDLDAATARSKLIAVHVKDSTRPREHYDLAGTYDWHLVRRSDSWRIQSVVLTRIAAAGTDPRRVPD